MQPNKENLKTLAYYLLNGLKAKFDMSHYCIDSSTEGTCGSSGCAIGHGPYATGILRDKCEPWSEYCMRVFGIENGSEQYRYMFYYTWCVIDNTPTGAGRRIIRFLSHDCKVPKGFETPSDRFVI